MNRFQHYLVTEYAEEYEEGRLTRREALKIIASITGSLIMANSILAACAPPPEELVSTQPAADTAPPSTHIPQPALAAHGTVSPDDPAVLAASVEFPASDATLLGYLARPAAESSFPVILVCHENRGLTDHIRDVARRLAKVGYTALAVDLLSRQGGSGALSASEVPGVLGNIAPDQFVQDFLSGVKYLQGQAFAQTDRIGMIGFCFGGGITWRVAAQMAELKAAAPFYGPHPDLEDVAGIQAAVLAVYGEQDQRINQGIPAIEEAMQQNGKIFKKLVYPDANHAFFNDTGSRYNAQAAQDAWNQVIAWFSTYI